MGSGRKSYYPEQLREKKVMTFTNHEAHYRIHPKIMEAYHTTLRADPELSRRYQKHPAPPPAAQDDQQGPKRGRKDEAGRNTLQRTDGGAAGSDSSEDEWNM